MIDFLFFTTSFQVKHAVSWPGGLCEKLPYQIITNGTKMRHICWWNVFDDMCRMGCWSFWSGLDVNWSITSDEDMRKNHFYIFRSQWPWPLDHKFAPLVTVTLVQCYCFCNSRSRSVFRTTVFMYSNRPLIGCFPWPWLPVHSLCCVPRPSGRAGAKISCDRAGRCMCTIACLVLLNQIELSGDWDNHGI